MMISVCIRHEVRGTAVHSKSEMVMTQRSYGWKNKNLTAASIGLCFCLFLSLVGCGDSETARETPVDAESIIPKADPIESSPGELVMPEGFSDQAASSEETTSGGTSAVGSVGLEMPNVSGGNFESQEKPSESRSSSIRYESWDMIRQEVLSSKKITVVDLWSLACEPCLKEFPGLVQLHRDYPEQINCVSVNLDFDGRKTRPPESYEAEVEAFLQSVQAGKLTSYICSTASDDVFIEEKIPSIPVVMVFNSQGEMVKKFVDAGETVGFSYAKSVRPVVIEMLEQK